MELRWLKWEPGVPFASWDVGAEGMRRLPICTLFSSGTLRAESLGCCECSRQGGEMTQRAQGGFGRFSEDWELLMLLVSNHMASGLEIFPSASISLY